MNFFTKFYRHNFAKLILNQVCKPIVLKNYIPVIKLDKLSFLLPATINKIQFIATGSILTWLGFSQEDEATESELIMTIKRSILLSARGEYAKAEQMLHVALKLAQQQQSSEGILYVFDLMANLALERGEIAKSETLFVNVLQRLLSDGLAQDNIKVIHISLKLARLYHMKGEAEKAEIGFKWCLENLAKQNQENNKEVQTLNGIVQDWYGQFLLDKGQTKEALKYLKEAQRICTEVEGSNSEKSVLLLNDLGTISWQLGDLNDAEEYLNTALKLGRALEHFDNLGVIYANLGLVSIEKGLLNEAKKFCKEGWRLGNKQQNPDAIEQANYCFEQIKKHS